MSCPYCGCYMILRNGVDCHLCLTCGRTFTNKQYKEFLKLKESEEMK